VEHPFPNPRDLKGASQLQRELAARVSLTGDLGGIRTVAALDASSRRGEPLVAAAVLWDLEAQRVLEISFAATPPERLCPYVPGFLSFREAPTYLAALATLSDMPDLLLVDGQGVAHPRGLGIAAHLGVHLDLPSLGVAKSLLYGVPEGELPAAAGSAVPLIAKGAQVGWVYRSRARVNPLYLSPGHRLGVHESLALVRALPTPTKLPEPLRQAHLWAGRARKEGLRGRRTPG
jgi:deoxyribonuclease V